MSTPSQIQIVERVPSLSVLYLANLSQDTMDAALADGITEELIARLSQIDGLRVTSLYAALRYRARGAIDPKTVGRELGVRYVLHGTLRRAGPRIRVAVEVTEATTGYNLWAQTYDQGISDVFAMQDSVTIQVAAALRGRLTGPERKRLTPPRLTNIPEAFQAYVRGRAWVRARNPRAAADAAYQFRRAIALDPAFVAAYAELARLYALAVYFGWDIPGIMADSLETLAARTAARALALDSTSSDAWLAVALATRFSDRPRAIAFHRRAVALDSTNTEALHELAWAFIQYADEPDSALVTEQHVTVLDPFYSFAYASIAHFLNLNSRPVEALGWTAQGAAIDSTQPAIYWAMADADLLLGRPLEAQVAARRALRLGAPEAVARSLLTEARAAGGDSMTARAQLDSTAATMRQKFARAPNGLSLWETTYLAGAFAQMGEADSALAWLDRIRIGRRKFFRGWLVRYWALGPLRNDPRFQRLLEDSLP